jgi:hypothetical protein
MNFTSDNIERKLDRYREQVLHWNRGINLVSRRDPANRLEELIGQCRNTWETLANSNVANLDDASRLWYFDLGSGAGLPGIVWHVQMMAAGLPVRSLLVEPREKRAWFLKRVAREIGEQDLMVTPSRWNEVPEDSCRSLFPDPRPCHILVSLKALRLTDIMVLKGLAPFLTESESRETTLLIVRFYPPDQKWTDKLAGELEIPAAGQQTPLSGHTFRGEGGRVLLPATLPAASLVLSEYRIRTP